MRLLKGQNTNSRNIYGRGLQVDTLDQVIADSTNSIRIPYGTGDTAYAAGTPQNQRPTTPTNGQLRYNSTLNKFEGYENSAWRVLRYAEPFPSGITQQSLGNGDATAVVFGPMASGDVNAPAPAAAQNVLVLVENVFQLSTTNYTLEQSAGGNLTGPNQPYADGWYLKFTSPVDLGKPVTVLHNFDK